MIYIKCYSECSSRRYVSELCKDGIDAGWRKFGFYETISTDSTQIEDTIERVDGSKISAEAFIKDYESRYIPCIVTDLMDTWPAKENWTVKVCFLFLEPFPHSLASGKLMITEISFYKNII